MWRQSANHSLWLRWAWKTAPWEFQTKLLHYFFTSNNKSNLHNRSKWAAKKDLRCAQSSCTKLGFLSVLTWWWVTADRLLKATSTPNSKSLIHNKQSKTNSSPITRHMYAKRTIWRFYSSSSKCKDSRGQPQRDQGRILGTMCTCKEM